MSDLIVLTNYSDNLIDNLKLFDIERNGTNKPELRQKLIINKLKENYKIIKPSLKLTVKELSDLNVHSVQYIDFLSKCYNSWLNKKDEQYIGPNNGLIPLTFALNRSEEFYDKVIKNLESYRSIGYFIDDTMTPIYANTFETVIDCANVAYSVNEYIDKHKHIYVSTTFPGHHAKTSSGGGYCFINNSVLCAKKLISKGNKVCVLDIDYHHGNGAQEMNLKSNDMLTISIHASPEYDFPVYEGYENESNSNNMNIIFPRKAIWEDYKICLDKALAKINEYNADIIILAFGFDTYKKDPDASINYGCCLEKEDYIKIGKEINKLDKKVVVIQEGGYYMDDGAEIVHNLLNGIQK